MRATSWKKDVSSGLALASAAFLALGSLAFLRRPPAEPLKIETPSSIDVPIGGWAEVDVIFHNVGRKPLKLVTVRGLCASGACVRANDDGFVLAQHMRLGAGERQAFTVKVSANANKEAGKVDLACPVYYEDADGTLQQSEMRITGQRVPLKEAAIDEPTDR